MEIIVIAALIGLIPAMIAKNKGKSFGLWWLYGAALFIIALPHALIMKSDSREVEKQQLETGANKKCPYCAEIIKSEAMACRFCGRDVVGTNRIDAAAPSNNTESFPERTDTLPTATPTIGRSDVGRWLLGVCRR